LRYAPDPLTLINRYIQKVGDIPEKLLNLAIEDFWELHQKRNDSDETKEYWDNNWHNNIAAPFLQLINDESMHLKEEPNQSRQNKEEKHKIKILSEESVGAREERVRNYGYEIYKNLKEKYPNKKITKETVAQYIMKKEASLYRLLSKENPDKKQPALGAYLKELRKTH